MVNPLITLPGAIADVTVFNKPETVCMLWVIADCTSVPPRLGILEVTPPKILLIPVVIGFAGIRPAGLNIAARFGNCGCTEACNR